MQSKQIADNRARITEISKAQEKIDALVDLLDTRTVGKVTVFADGKARSSTIGFGIDMPSFSRTLRLFARPSFKGSVTVQCVYTDGTMKQFKRDSADFGTIDTALPTYQTDMFKYFYILAEKVGGKTLIGYETITVPLGSLDSVTAFIDHVIWT